LLKSRLPQELITMSPAATKPGKLTKEDPLASKEPTEPLTDAEIDLLLGKLTSEEIEALLEDVDPDDTHMPPSARCTYVCNKAPTGPLDRKKLLRFIHDEAKKMPDKIDHVPHVPGTIRGTKWVAPVAEVPSDDCDSLELDIALGDEIELALGEATTADMVDLAGIMGLHSMISQEQYHHAVGTNTYRDEQLDPDLGWDGITKATPLKYFPPEPPNETDPEEVLANLKSGDEEQTEVNLNNVEVSEKQMLEIFEALKSNKVLTTLSMSNTNMTDWAASNLAHTLENNDNLESLNLESNNVTPRTLAKIFESLNVQESIKEMKAMNQAAQVMGNKVEMAITKSIENNRTLLKVGLQFEFNECQNRVAVHLQKNLDRVRLKRIAAKLADSGNSTAGYFVPLPGAGSKDWKRAATPESEYEWYYSDDE